MSAAAQPHVYEGWVYGIDVNSSRIGLGLVHADTGAFQTNACTWRSGWRGPPPLPVSLDASERTVQNFLTALRRHFPCSGCVIEQPKGPHPNPSLMAHWGAVQVAAYRALNIVPMSMDPPTWRRMLGIANKKAAALLWAVNAGMSAELVDGDNDQAEGLGIAAAGTLALRSGAPLAWHPRLPGPVGRRK